MTTGSARDVGAVAALGATLQANISSALKVPEPVIRQVLVALVADGHVLVEDYPGVGKTSLARALTLSVGAEFARVQCTSDLLPADVLGTNVFNQPAARFEFRPGPIFANIVLVDEINRASPRTQSGLLECMQERRVTVDTQTHQLARPFLVIATQNPVEYEGTYPLPEAQLDRFMVRVALGYPSPADEADMIAEQADRPLVDELRPVAGISDVVVAQEAATTVHASQALRDYVVALVNATRADPRTDLGASPRAGLMLLKAAKAHAALAERDHVLPDDVQVLAEPVLAHRLMLAPEAGPASGAELIRDAMEGLPAL